MKDRKKRNARARAASSATSKGAELADDALAAVTGGTTYLIIDAQINGDGLSTQAGWHSVGEEGWHIDGNAPDRSIIKKNPGSDPA